MTYWFTARICSSLLAMSIPVGSAWSQGGDQANVTPQMPLSQAVTFADLEGAKIHAKLVTEMLAERQGRRGPATQEIDWQIYLEPDGRINFGQRATTITSRGTRGSQLRVSTHKLDEPWSIWDNGKAVWQFKDGDLTFISSYDGGATLQLETGFVNL